MTMILMKIECMKSGDVNDYDLLCERMHHMFMYS